MRIRRLVLASLGIAFATLTNGVADAQTSPPKVVFDAVTSYSSTSSTSLEFELIVTGVQHGASAPSTVTFTLGQGTQSAPTVLFQSCEKQVLVAINRPGRVSLAVTLNTAAIPPTTGTSGPYPVYGCALTQLP